MTLPAQLTYTLEEYRAKDGDMYFGSFWGEALLEEDIDGQFYVKEIWLDAEVRRTERTAIGGTKPGKTLSLLCLSPHSGSELRHGLFLAIASTIHEDRDAESAWADMIAERKYEEA